MVHVGAILPLTGDAAAYGTSMRRGMELALTEVNPQRPHPLGLLFEDSQADPKLAVSAYRKLKDRHGVMLILGPFTSGETLAVAPQAERDRVVVISTGASSPAVSEAGDFIFRIVSSDLYDADVVARFLRDRLKARRIAVVYINNAYGAGVYAAFEKRLLQLEGEVILSEGYSETEGDFRTIATKVVSAAPDAVFLVGHQEMGRFLRQAQEVGMRADIMSTGLFEDPTILETAGRAAEGVYYSYPTFDLSGDDPVLRRFAQSFEERFDSSPDNIAALGYDAVKIADRVTAVRPVSSNDIKTTLYKIDQFHGATGIMRFDERGDVVKTFGVKRVQDGKFHWIERKF